jgi:DNA-binding MarR family transcriptional regulator
MTTDAIGHQGKGTATGPSLNPQVIGQAENALRALLDRTLAGTGLAYRHWIALSLTVGNDAPVAQDELIERITGVLKVDDTAAREAVADLRARKLAETVPGDGSRVQPTDAGRELHREVRMAIAEIVTRLFRDITADDLETAGRVLMLITARADAELAGS